MVPWAGLARFAPVPPFAVGRMPLTPAVREIRGISAATRALKVGAAAAPLVGPARAVFAVWLARTAVRVPVVVTGEPETVRKDGRERATEVTPVLLMVAFVVP